MNNLYVIAIGGSGERVLRSFTMTLAAGVDLPVSQVIPVIVDNDVESAALTRCTDLIKAYREDRDSVYPGVHHLYGSMNPKPSFCHVPIAEPLMLDVSGGGIGKLKEVIGCPQSKGDDDPYAPAIKALSVERDLLFTQDELDMPLDVGFVGCPNIGSVVLNSKSLSSANFNQVMAATSNDGIIVLGSLFGGTGAAGIPLIINKLLQNTTNEKPQIGVVAMLPYFQIDSAKDPMDTPKLDKSKYDVNSDIFDIKTRAALMYYDRNMSKRVDYMYYVGDSHRQVVKKSLGGVCQDNPAMLCDVMAAMAIVDFANGRTQTSTMYKLPVWGFTDADDSVSNCTGVFSKELKKALVKFIMMEQVFRHPDIMSFAIRGQRQVFDFVKNINFDASKLDSILTTTDVYSINEAKGLNFIIRAFDEWLSELAKGNKRTQTMGRSLKIFDSTAKVSADELARAFFTDAEVAGMGLSKWVHKKPLFGKESDEAVQEQILDELQAAYHSLPNQYQQNIEEKMVLPVVLLYISKALDNIIDKSCNI